MFKPTVKPLKNAKRRVIGYRASIFDGHAESLNADGATKAAAIEALYQHTAAAIRRLDRGTQILQWKGATIVVSPGLDGWEYWTSVFGRTDYKVIGGDTREDALDRALTHTAQNIWHEHMNDEDFVTGLPPGVRSELLGYFKWQRDYKHLTAVKRYTDTEARNILGGFLKDDRP